MFLAEPPSVHRVQRFSTLSTLGGTGNILGGALLRRVEVILSRVGVAIELVAVPLDFGNELTANSCFSISLKNTQASSIKVGYPSWIEASYLNSNNNFQLK